jgi:hypothetical protein
MTYHEATSQVFSCKSLPQFIEMFTVLRFWKCAKMIQASLAAILVFHTTTLCRLAGGY